MKDSIIFCGDLVFPFGCMVDYSDVKQLFTGKIAVANLEGAILPNEKEVEGFKWDDKFSLYSCPNVINIMEDLNIKYVSLCNNHILDYKWPIDKTEELLSKHGIGSFGLSNPDYLDVGVGQKKFFVITFATYACEHSLPLFCPVKVIKCINYLKSKWPNCSIAVFPHWGIEKNRFPEPADVSLAHQCIDAGADIVVGHHPHIVQHIEKYKKKYIIYSIGNFILPQTFYGNRKLTYQDPFIQNELLVEWDGENVMLHSLYYDVSSNRVLRLNEFPQGSLYEKFTPPMSRWRYLTLYSDSMKNSDLIFRSRYFATRFEEIRVFLSRKMVRCVRRMLIKLGLHNPYKQPS